MTFTAELVAALIAICAPATDRPAMAAIVYHESRRNPLAIGVNGARKLARQPRNIDEAVAWGQWLLDNGYSVDFGLAQINSQHLRKHAIPLAKIYDPCFNVALGAWILDQNRATAASKFPDPTETRRRALSLYNTGSFEAGLKNGYVAAVESLIPQAGTPLPKSPPSPRTDRRQAGRNSAISANIDGAQK